MTSKIFFNLSKKKILDVKAFIIYGLICNDLFYLSLLMYFYSLDFF